MTFRRLAPLALALGALSCQPSVPGNSNPAYVDYAVFDPATSSIPVPNDLALLSVPAAACVAPQTAQQEFICMLQAAGGFPNDQEVPVEFSFLRVPLSGGSPTAPPLDLASVRWCFATPPAAPPADCNLMMLRVDQALPAPVDPATLDLSYSAATGVLTIRNKPDPAGRRIWPAGARYVVAVRGGASGLATTDGGYVNPQPAMYLLLQDKDLSLPQNQTLFSGTDAQKMAAGQALEQLRLAYANPVPPAPLSVFALVNSMFPYREIADLTTFAIAPGGTYVIMDAGAGIVPLPSDFLLDPATGKVRAGIAPGLDTLDGFSTTAMIVAQTSEPVKASTVTASAGTATGTVSLWQSTATGWVRVHDLAEQVGSGGAVTANYVGQPVVDGSGNSPFIGLQPAVPAQIPVAPFLATLPPLKGTTEYAVVITTGVQDAAGNGLIPNTVGKILLFSNPLSIGGKSQLVGVDDATAAGLEAMRLALAPVLATAGVAKSQVAMAYTIRMQTIPDTSVALTAAPYAAETGGGSAIFSPISAVFFDPTTLGFPSQPNVAEFVAATVPTFDTWDKATGALAAPAATGLPWPLTDYLDVLVAVPLPASVATSCPAPATALKCAPLVVVHHGLRGGHLQMIAVANELAKAGFVVASTDMPFHGDRAYCQQNSDCTTSGVSGPNGVCTPIPGTATQGDLVPPGTCTTGTLRPDPTLTTTVASGNYFISANFFRTRDGIRRDLLDQSALVLALARPPAPYPQPAANPLAARLVNDGIAVDITRVYYLGVSLGSIVGTSVAATNPRVSRAVLNVGGGTAVDIMTNSPAFRTEVEALFASLIPGFTFAKVTPGDPAFDPVIAAEYLKLVSVAKWVLDPAESLNFAASVGTKLPSPLAAALGPLASATTDAWGMVANGDTVIPNPFSFELFGVGGIPFTVYASASAPGNAVPHGFLATTTSAQDDAAAFLNNLTNPGAQVMLP